jgi:predicted RNase H-like HicB family nuclease
MEEYNIIIEKDKDGWYFSEVIGLPGCHTQAKTIDQLIERTKEAIKAYKVDFKSKEKISSFVAVQQIKV